MLFTCHVGCMRRTQIKTNMSKNDRTEGLKLNFEIDLAQAAFYHVEFLEQVHGYPCLFGGKYLEKALVRYEKFWLPLASKFENTRLAAPLDIEWVWHCHILSPEAYKKDCEQLVSGFVDHKLMSKLEREEAIDVSRRLWKEAYGNEPFEQNLPVGIYQSRGHDTPIIGSSSKIEYDLRAAVSRQSSFYYNVSLPHYRDPKFLYLCVDRYKMFLYLKKLHPKQFLVPCYDNDLVWHTHQLFPSIYRQETSRILGKVLDHDDSTTDRSTDSFLTKSFQTTSKLWKETYGETYNFPGGMYRGVCSRGIYSDIELNMSNDADDTTELIIDVMSLDRNPVGGNVGFLISLSLVGKSERQIMALKGPPLMWDEDDLQIGGIDVSNEENVLIIFYKKNRFLKNEEIHRHVLDVHTLPVKHVDSGWSFFKMEERFSTKTRDKITLFIEGKKRFIGEPPKFKVKPSDFQKCIIADNFEECFEFQDYKFDEQKSCDETAIANHSIQDIEGVSVFGCRVLHNAHHNLSYVQILNTHNKTLTLAKIMDSSHLPLPTQVSPDFLDVTLSPKLGERAILIKDNEGDWAFVIGRWQQEDEERSEHGCLVYRVYFNRSCRIIHGTFPRKDNDFIISLDSCSLDVFNGKLTMVGCTPSEIPQYITGLLVIGQLFVLCVPRPANWKPGEKIETEETKHLSFDSMNVLGACGLYELTPSNFYRSKA